MNKKIMLLGSGELGRELTISLKRLGCYVVACDRYARAPAMQVADEFRVFDMLDGQLLDQHVKELNPHIIVPEIEAINTDMLMELEEEFVVVPSARAVSLTMNRDRIRDRAHELGLPTARFAYAENLEELLACYERMDCKVVIKPVMSSSGKGQSVVHAGRRQDAAQAWHDAVGNMRGDRAKVIIEEFIEFDDEITLLTIRQKNGHTIFCPAIKHEQVQGDFKNSQQGGFVIGGWEQKAQAMAKLITDDLGGFGLFGVEFFIRNDEVIFSELSPRPHDTGLVTLYTQDLSEFDLHARAMLHIPVASVSLMRSGACCTINAHHAADDYEIMGLDQAEQILSVQVMLFDKPNCYPNRRLGIVFGSSLEVAREGHAKISIQ